MSFGASFLARFSARGESGRVNLATVRQKESGRDTARISPKRTINPVFSR